MSDLSAVEIDIVTDALALYLSEAGEYYYEDVLLKRSLTGDSASGPCEICDDNEAEGWIDSEEVYPSGDDGPPFHPNAVLAGSTFIPYGRLQRMVAAEYNGVAVTLLAGEYRTTIGPNHPMLTARGLVRAKLLQIGDQLICDSRAIKTLSITDHSDFDEICKVEDVFAAIKAAFGHSSITASADDFHGDLIRQDKEVQVVFPKRELLRVLDSFGVERLRESGFMLPDVKAGHITNSSFTNEQLNTFLLATSGGVRGASVGMDSSCHFELASIESIMIEQTNRMAFDASTEVGLYCSDGFVVSNCVCEEEYKESRRRVYV